MYRCLLVITAVSTMTMMTNAQEKPAADDSKGAAVKNDPVGYFLGLSIGQDLLRQTLKSEDFTPEALAEGIRDALERNKPRLSEEQLSAAGKKLQDLVNKRSATMFAELQRKGEENLKAGTLWLAENAKKEGIKQLAGGLQYKVLNKGDGGSPTPSDTVRVHYTGKLTSGKIFDSSVKRGKPAEFVVNGVIKGWQMALQEMKVGDKWMLFIPPALAYGERGSPGAIGPNEVLIFEVELLDIL